MSLLAEIQSHPLPTFFQIHTNHLRRKAGGHVRKNLVTQPRKLELVINRDVTVFKKPTEPLAVKVIPPQKHLSAFKNKEWLACVSDRLDEFNQCKLSHGVKPKLAEILDEVCELTGMSRESVLSTKRTFKLSKTRAIFCWRAKMWSGCSQNRIAYFLGIDHSSVIHAIGRCEAMGFDR